MTGRNPGGTPGTESFGRESIGAGPAGAEPIATDSQLPGGVARLRTLRWAAALIALFTVAATTACAGPPSKGEVHGALLNQSHNNVVILAREPTHDMSPEQLVNSFLQALTGDQKDPTFGVAQEYLTADARARWISAGATWVTTTKIVAYGGPTVESGQTAAIEHGGHPAAVPSAATPQPTPAGPAVGEVKMVSVSGPEIAQIDKYGFFQYLSQSQPVVQTFSVKYMGPATGWRIAVPPEFRMVDPGAFTRAYQAYQSPLPVYLPTHAAQPPRMDQVYLTQATGKIEDTYGALARAVLHGRYPWQDTGVDLLGQVTIDAGQAVVTLKVPDGGAPNISDLQHALFLTFRDAAQMPQLLSPTPLTSLQVTYPGCTAFACQTQVFNSEGLPASTVYWVCPQGGPNSGASAIVALQVISTTAAPTACPADGAKVPSVVGLTGIHLQPNAPIAVKQTPDPAETKVAASTTMAAVVKDNGDVVVVNDKNSESHPWYQAHDASKVTDLEWDPVDGSLWVVDNQNLYRVQDPGDRPPSSATEEFVVVPGQAVLRFKPSRDGLRAVVVSPQPADGSGTAGGVPPAMMVTLDRVDGSLSLSTDTEFQLLVGPSQTMNPLSPALKSVQDAAWADDRTVELLGVQSGSTTAKLYKVYLDGSQDSTIIDPDDAQPGATHITAATGTTNGHPGPWTISDASVANAWTVTFKRNGGSDSFQEVGSNPVIATVVRN